MWLVSRTKLLSPKNRIKLGLTEACLGEPSSYYKLIKDITLIINYKLLDNIRLFFTLQDIE